MSASILIFPILEFGAGPIFGFPSSSLGRRAVVLLVTSLLPGQSFHELFERVNVPADQVFRHTGERVAVVSRCEDGRRHELTRDELRERVGSVAAWLEEVETCR